MKEEEGIILITESRNLALLFQSLMIREFNNNFFSNVMVSMLRKMCGMERRRGESMRMDTKQFLTKIRLLLASFTYLFKENILNYTVVINTHSFELHRTDQLFLLSLYGFI